MRRAYRAAGSMAEESIPIGSVKANIGHLGPASGVAGLIKVCLALENQQLPPSINYDRPNPSLELDMISSTIARATSSWRRSESRKSRS